MPYSCGKTPVRGDHAQGVFDGQLQVGTVVATDTQGESVSFQYVKNIQAYNPQQEHRSGTLVAKDQDLKMTLIAQTVNIVVDAKQLTKLEGRAQVIGL